MIGLAALCLAGSLGFALVLLLIARAMGWRRRRIGMLVRPWLLAILILLTIGLAADAGGGIAALTRNGWIIAGAWLAVSVAAHVLGRGSRNDPARLWGGRVAHGGVAIALGGILLSSFFTSTVERPLAPGDSVRSSGWTIQLHDVWPAAGAGWAGVSAELRASSGDGVVILEPKQLSRHGNAPIFEPARFRDGGGLLTASFGPRDGEGRWLIRFSWTPLLVLIPIGLVIAAFGLMVALVGPGLLRWRRLRRARLATAWWA